jgi:hypothetical protein
MPFYKQVRIAGGRKWRWRAWELCRSAQITSHGGAETEIELLERGSKYRKVLLAGVCLMVMKRLISRQEE